MIGFHQLHSDANFNFQLNRLLSDGTPEMLPEVTAAAGRIASFTDWAREMFTFERAESGFERHAVPFEDAVISAIRYKSATPRDTIVVCGGCCARDACIRSGAPIRVFADSHPLLHRCDIARVTQDVLLLAGADDHFVPLRQLAQQRAVLTNAKSVTERVFRRDEDAASHCQVGNFPLAIETIAAWIEEHL